MPEGTTRQLFRNLQRGLVCQKNPSYAAFTLQKRGSGRHRNKAINTAQGQQKHPALSHPHGAAHSWRRLQRVLHYLRVSFLRATSPTLKMWIKGRLVHTCGTPQQAASAARQCPLISRRKRGHRNAWSLRTQRAHAPTETFLQMHSTPTSGGTWAHSLRFAPPLFTFCSDYSPEETIPFCLAIIVW